MDGIETTRATEGHAIPRLGIVALTGSEDQRAVRDMLVAGASGYVLKDSDGDEIIHAIRQAATGGGVISPEVTPTVIESSPRPSSANDAGPASWRSRSRRCSSGRPGATS